jgi:hypothetical protein
MKFKQQVSLNIEPQKYITRRAILRHFGLPGSALNLGERFESLLTFAIQAVGASAPTYGQVQEGLLSPEASGAKAPVVWERERRG